MVQQVTISGLQKTQEMWCMLVNSALSSQYFSEVTLISIHILCKVEYKNISVMSF